MVKRKHADAIYTAWSAPAENRAQSAGTGSEECYPYKTGVLKSLHVNKLIHFVVERNFSYVNNEPAFQTINALFSSRDPHTLEHMKSVARAAGYVGMYVKYPDIPELIRGAYAHDLGKITDELQDIVSIPGTLTDEQWAIMKTHPEAGIRLARQLGLGFSPAIENVIAHHHTKKIKRSYGPSEELVPKHQEHDQAVQITAAVDAVLSMIDVRDYRAEPYTIDEAIAQAKEGIRADPAIFQAIGRLLLPAAQQS